MRSEKKWAAAVAIAMLVSSIGGPVAVPAVKAQSAPVGAGFNINAADLRFILTQIKIAEAHAAGGSLLGPGPNQISSPLHMFGLRTVDGSFNNLQAGQDTFGQADQPFPRLAPASFRPAEAGTSYANVGSVTDSQPRLISNLIVDQTATNPAAVAAAGVGAVADASGTLFIGNTAPDVGLSAPYNSMFTIFGQFFDHGLDLVTKGGNGTVLVPLQADDPLFVVGSPTNFMAISRATNQPGGDGILGTADDIQNGINTTTPWVDQNQTYTSHPSHQVFLRAYTTVDGRPQGTGRMIDGANSNIGSWAEVKQQAATELGIRLTDADVFNVPLVLTDPYGYFKRGSDGYPQLVLPGNGLLQGDPTANGGLGIDIPANALRTGHAFLDDIAHNAAPKPGLTADADTTISVFGVTVQPAGTYDDELLDRHFCTGDGRGNENIALATVHTVFHAEHNRIAAEIGNPGGLVDTLLTAAEIADWHAVNPDSGWDYNERVFQAARFVTEMEYQHLVFEEFARKMQPQVNLFASYDTSINPAISAEYAHSVYRFGHSMLNETVARINEDGSANDMPLVTAFLNPLAFNDGGTAGPLTAAQAAGSVFQGMSAQVGNELDEFVTEALRNRLLGLPLDLPTINMARGRSEGIPTLNVSRQNYYNATGDFSVAPYTSWFDFQFGIRHPESVINFIAAFGTGDAVLDAATTLAAKRARATVLSTNGAYMFLPAATSGVNDIDLWVGGLAEKQAPFGGLLGSTFNFVFERQLENLQDGDRFYYLGRLVGQNLLVQLEGNSFSELVMRNTTATGMPADVFSKPDLIFNVENLGTTGPILDDVTTPDDESAMLDLIRMPDGTIRYLGPLHVVFNGSDVAGDRIFSSEGDDTLRGSGGNDVMEGGAGNDQFLGGMGDDILTDNFGDDVLKGGDGNDAISSGQGFDLNQGGPGQDFVWGGSDPTETFGGPGNDFIFAGDSSDTVFGDDGDDWIEGGGQADLLQGDNGFPFQDDPNGGHDVIIGGGGADDFDSEGGDDIMVAGPGTERNEGMLGFDWATHKDDPQPADDDLNFTGLLPPNVEDLRDRFDFVEGLSGWNFNDLLRGDDKLDIDLIGHELTTPGIARIAGLSAILPAGAGSFTGGNIILGGAGNDMLEGRGGNDILDGRRWLNVQIGNGAARFDNMSQLRTAVFAGTINPGNLTIVRSIVLGADGIDTAVFTGPAANYTITGTLGSDAPVTVTDTVGLDGVDTLRNIDRLLFLGDPQAVPTMTGQTQAEATGTLAQSALVFGATTFETSTTIALNRVIRSIPAAGTLVPTGSSVTLVLSLGAPVNRAPVAVNNTYTVAANATLTTALAQGVLANDTDADGNALTAVLNNGPAVNALAPGAATFVFNTNGTFTYSHGVGIVANTPVTFRYRANDGTANSNLATVTINVTRPAGQPVANADTATTTVGTPVTTNVVANDVNGGAPGGALLPATLIVRRQPVNGTAVVVAGQVTYTPNAGFTGVNTYTYTVADLSATSNVATVTVTVAGAPVGNTAPTVNITAPAAGTVTGTINVTANANDNVAVLGVQFLLDGVNLGAEDTTAPYSTSWNTTLATNGAHTLTALARDGGVPVLTTLSAAVAVTVNNVVVPPPAGGDPTVVLNLVSNGSGTRNVTGVTTVTPGVVLLALTGADGPLGANLQATTVTGAGLTWTRVRQARTQSGVAEIWTATAAGVLTNQTVTSTLLGGAFQHSLRVIGFTNVSGIGASNVSGAVGATATLPSVSLVTAAAGSVVYAVGNDWAVIGARTVGAGQTIVGEYSAAGLVTVWSQSLNGITGAIGSTVVLNTTAPASTEWNMAIVELRR